MNTIPKYLPFLKGKYTVTAGLKSLDKAEGIDSHVFQIDESYSKYISNKMECRSEGIEKYYLEHELDDETRLVIDEFIITKLTEEYPEYFKLDKSNLKFYAALTNETLNLDDAFNLRKNPKYQSLFDALGSQVQEDIAIFKFTEKSDWLAAVHLCAPNHWAAGEKIGKNYDFIHESVPGMEKMRRHYYPLLKSVLDKGPFYRFAWGISTDNRLNHHPVAPRGIDKKIWAGRKFDLSSPELFIRVERQTLTGFPDNNALLFTIRTYFYDVHDFSRSEKEALISAINSMTTESLQYKGITHSKRDIVEYLSR